MSKTKRILENKEINTKTLQQRLNILEERILTLEQLLTGSTNTSSRLV